MDNTAEPTLEQRLEATRPEAPMDPVARLRLRRSLVEGTGPSEVHYSGIDTPMGMLWLAYAGETVRCTDLAVPEELFRRQCAQRFRQEPQRDGSPPGRIRRAIDRYLEKGGPYSGPVDLSGLPEFHQRVLRQAMKIRRGEVRPYGWLAREVGAPGAARAVGTAMARNPIPILIPCHRVVRTDYHIGEYGCGGPEKKKAILDLEGVDVQGLERLATRGVRFQGARSTRIFCLPGCYTGRRMRPESHVQFTSEAEARAAGFRPCKVCRPVAVGS